MVLIKKLSKARTKVKLFLRLYYRRYTNPDEENRRPETNITSPQALAKDLPLTGVSPS
jgi:hypothetical protein